MKLNSRGEEEENEEVREGFELFLRMGKEGGRGKGKEGEERITMGMLKHVAGLLKENVSDDVLRDMILEANGGGGVGQGVGLQDFEGVMRRGPSCCNFELIRLLIDCELQLVSSGDESSTLELRSTCIFRDGRSLLQLLQDLEVSSAQT